MVQCQKLKILKPPYPLAPCSYAERGDFGPDDTEFLGFEDIVFQSTTSTSTTIRVTHHTTLLEKFLADCSSILTQGIESDLAAIGTCMWANMLAKGMLH